jgi:tight adherence protein B
MILASSLAFFLVIFLLASILTAIAYLAFLRMKADQSDAEQSDRTAPKTAVGSQQREHDGREELGFGFEPSPLLQSGRLSSITFWDSVLAHFDFGALLQNRLDQADLRWSVGRITSMMLLVGVVVLAVLMRLLPLWAAFLGAAAAMTAPYGYVLRRRRKRFEKFRENFPDALDSLARALRAGYPLSAGMEMIANETAPPVSGEIRRTSAEANLGRGWPHALEGLGRRIPILEINLFIAAVQLHARTGGKLSEVMSGMAENMRESNALQGEVRALAAYGKLTGLILTILPIGIAIMMLIVSPGYMQVLFNDPMGKNLIALAIGCLILAHFVIRKIVDIQV